MTTENVEYMYINECWYGTDTHIQNTDEKQAGSISSAKIPVSIIHPMRLTKHYSSRSFQEKNMEILAHFVSSQKFTGAHIYMHLI